MAPITVNPLGLLADIAGGSIQSVAPPLAGTVAVLYGPGSVALPSWYQGVKGTLEVVMQSVVGYAEGGTPACVALDDVEPHDVTTLSLAVVINPGNVADCYVQDATDAVAITTLFPPALPDPGRTYVFRLAWDSTTGAGAFRVNGVPETAELFVRRTPFVPFPPRFLRVGLPQFGEPGRVVRATLSNLYLP